MAEAPTVLVFDSGLGGLTVFREIVKVRPDANYVYTADDAYFPYGEHGDVELIDRVVSVIAGQIEAHTPDLIVIACNTASTIVLPELRARFDLPFVGTVPAIKPACAMSRSKLVSVLGTEATVGREYTQGLIRDFAQDCAVTLVGSTALAHLAEAELRNQPVDDAAVRAEIAPCFVEGDEQRTDVVVLACTHYPLLLDRLQRLSPWPVQWVDPAEAIARRVLDLLGPAPERTSVGQKRFVFTSGETPLPALQASMTRFGFDRSSPA
jgi:glutamate racemase